MLFKSPYAALFFHHSPDKLIVACKEDIFMIDVRTQFTQSFSSTTQGAYFPHAIAISDDDAVLVAGCYNTPYSVCGYDAASRTRLWILNTVSGIGAVCMLGAHVLVTVSFCPTLVLDRNTGAQIAALPEADGWIQGLGVIEGLCFVHSCLLILSDFRTSVYLAMLQHLLSKQVKPLRLPLEMWDWIAKYCM
jgi:hypothetical protein